MLSQRNLLDVYYALVHFNISSEFNGVELGSGKVDQIKAPTLVLQGERDLVVPRKIGEEIANKITNAELIVLEDCGHSPMIDCLDVFVDRMVDFLDK